MSKKTRGSLLLLLTAAIWGCCFVAQSNAADDIGPYLFVFTRFLIGGVLLIPVAAFLNHRSVSAGEITEEDCRKRIGFSVKAGMISGIFLFGGSIFQQIGLITTTAGKSGFITALYIVFVPIAGILIGKKPPLTMWISVAAAITGFYLLCMKDGFQIAEGDFYTLLCAVSFTVQIMTIDHFTEKGTDPIIFSSTQFLTVSLISFFPMMLKEGFDMNLLLAAKWSVLYAGIFSSGVAYTLQIFGQRDTPPALATLIMSLESVFAALSGWLILHEVLSARELLGCALVFAAVLFAQFAPGSVKN